MIFKKAHRDYIICLDQIDDDLIVTGSLDKTIVVWTAPKLNKLKVIKTNGELLQLTRMNHQTFTSGDDAS